MLDSLGQTLDWVLANKKWLFSGVGIVLIAGIINLLRKRGSASQKLRSGAGSQNLQAGGDIKISLASGMLSQPDPNAVLQDLSARMPKLFAEMKTDLQGPDNEFVREFFVSPRRGVNINDNQRRFVYYEEEHKNLMGKLQVLEGHGFLGDVTPGNAPMYRMTEEFVRFLRDS